MLIVSSGWCCGMVQECVWCLYCNFGLAAKIAICGRVTNTSLSCLLNNRATVTSIYAIERDRRPWLLLSLKLTPA